MVAQTTLEQISKIGFIASVSSYAIFWLMDAARPGFVARYFSVHIFLLVAIVFGIIWARDVRVSKDHKIFQYIIATFSGAVACVITWHLATGVDERVLPAVLAIFVPFLVLVLLRSKAL